MRRPRANFMTQYSVPGWFKDKFNREPKNWTIEQVHDLYLRAKERYEKRRDIICEYGDKIVKEIPKNKNGEHIVYYYLDNRICYYSLSYSDTFKSYGVSQGDIQLKTLKEKLEFLTKTENAFKLGEKYKELNKLRTTKHYIVKEIMLDMINEKLSSRFKDVFIHSHTIIAVQIGNKKYYMKSGENSGHYYRFELYDEFTEDDCINLNN